MQSSFNMWAFISTCIAFRRFKTCFFFFSIFYPFMGQKTDLLITHLKSIYNPITWEISDLKGNRHDKEWIC